MPGCTGALWDINMHHDDTKESIFVEDTPRINAIQCHAHKIGKGACAVASFPLS